MRAKSSNHTKAAFGTGKQILNKMQEKGWTVAPGGQLIKPKPKPKPRTKGDGAILIRTQDGIVALGGKEPIDTETMEPVAKSPKLESKVISSLQKEASSAPSAAPQDPGMDPSSSGIDDANEGGLIQFSIEGEIAKMKKENEKKGLKKTNQEHLEDLPGHLNTNAPVFDRIRDRVAQEKADARKQNAFASATETETEVEFEDVPPKSTHEDEATTTDFDEEDFKPIKPKTVSSKPAQSKSLARQASELSEMSDLSDIPTLSDLGESEIDEDMRTVKELVGATNNINGGGGIDIRLSTDDESQSELHLTDIDPSEKIDSNSDNEYAHSLVSRMTGGTMRPGPGYNTGTIKSNISGFTVALTSSDQDEIRPEDIFSDATMTDSDDLPLPTPIKPKSQTSGSRPTSPTKSILSKPTPPIPEKPPSIRPTAAPVATPSPVAQNFTPFNEVKLKPIGQNSNKRPVDLKPVIKTSPRPPVSIIKQRESLLTTDDDEDLVLPDASATEDDTDFELPKIDTNLITDTDSDWPEPTPIKPMQMVTDTDSDWPEPQAIKPKPAQLSKTALNSVRQAYSTSVPKINSQFDKLKPMSPKKPIVESTVEESCISDGSSASDADLLSDGITTEHDSDFMV